MIEIFKTNIANASEAGKLVSLLLGYLPQHKINIDLHDCDRILRIEGAQFIPAAIVALVTGQGYTCLVLE